MGLYEEAHPDKTGIREYGEEYPVEIMERIAIPNIELRGVGRLVICAINEGGYNGVSIDLLDVIEWVKKNRPELLGIDQYEKVLKMWIEIEEIYHISKECPKFKEAIIATKELLKGE